MRISIALIFGLFIFIIGIQADHSNSTNLHASNRQESSALTPEEQAYIMTELALHPDATMWTIFKNEVVSHYRLWKQHPFIFIMVRMAHD